MLEYRLLGPLEVVADDAPIRLGGPKQRATLAILLLNANRVVSVDRIAEEVYAGSPPVTAVAQVQRQVWELRKALADDRAIETRPPGYLLRAAPGQTDLDRFERLAQAATAAGPERAAVLLREALELWRGEALADLAGAPFAAAAARRLDEIRLAALEQRIDAELALGRHRELVPELESLRAEHPLREDFAAQLMLALYRSGRQADALAAYREARDALVEELGIEPGPRLRALERSILRQEEPLHASAAASAADSSSVLVVASGTAVPDGPLRLARLLGAEVIVVRLLADERELASVAPLPAAEGVRAAAFISSEPVEDTVRLAISHDVELVLMQASAEIAEETLLPAELQSLVERSPADVGLLVGDLDDPIGGGGVFVPFGGGDHDWTALEVAARLATGAQVSLTLVGTRADAGRRDASRLLADASLAVQRVAGVAAAPVLAKPTEQDLIEAVEPASLVVAGIAPRWRREGIGRARRALVAHARPPVLLVHDGPRPSGLAPRESRTRFSWTLAV